MDPQVNVDFLLCIFFGPTLKIYKFEKFHRFIITVYSLLADTPHKRTPLLNGRFFCDRPFHMLLLIKKILLSGLF
jgi:hypothetical protein